MIKVKPQALKYKDAVDFWESKVKLSPSGYRKLSDEAKMKAFAVAGIAKGDELETVYNALSQAIEGNINFEDFKKQCSTIFEKRGWTGISSWRVDNIFRTNVQAAYMAGRWKQASAASNLRPYGQYSAINDKRTRPTHTAMHGVVYPLDHSFWDTWWPLNGFRCRCNVKTLSERQVKKRGIEVKTEDITGKLVEPVDPRTGNKLPARLLMPDPGFMFHPGKSAFGGIVDSSIIKNPKQLPDMPGPADYKRKKLENVKPSQIPDINETKLLPAGKDDQFYIKKFTELYGKEKVIKDALGEPAILSLRSFMANKTPGKETYKFNKPGHGQSIPVLGQMLVEPFEIWLTPQKDSVGKIRLTKRYICVWKTEDKKRIGGFAVFETYHGVLQGVTSFLPMDKSGKINLKYLERQRVGALLYAKGRKG
jgi:SPP1 gp7 family putative phage head morphogenesis protein